MLPLFFDSCLLALLPLYSNISVSGVVPRAESIHDGGEDDEKDTTSGAKTQNL
jgi:hypothetical protein